MIYFIESIPAGGKSYYARKTLNQLGGDAILYKEEYYNPIDVFRQALLTENEYSALLKSVQVTLPMEDVKKIISEFENGISQMDRFLFLPYMHASQSKIYISKYLPYLYQKEICDGQIHYSTYFEIILNRIRKFIQSKDSNKNYIFEGAILHNPLITILGEYSLSEDMILSFYWDVYKILRDEDYVFRYINVENVRQCVLYANQKRSNASEYNWMAGFDWWFKHSKNYSNYRGIEGIIAFSNSIKEIEEKILYQIPFEITKIERRIV